MLGFTTDRGTDFALERLVKHRPEIGLQLQASAHAHFEARA